MSTTTQQTTATAWPEGVIARYLTVGGATVDLRPGSDSCESVCGGCDAREFSRGFTYINRAAPGTLRELAVRDAKEWSQEHASECRAMPKPEASR